ncbi:MAG: hypothetical protein WAX85_02635 [Minisyncoccia bacterium]
MKKNIVQDVIPPKKSIRNIGLSRKSNVQDKKIEREPVKPILEPAEKELGKVSLGVKPIKTERLESAPPIKSSYDYDYDEPKKPSKKVLYISVSILLLALIFGISALFKSAVIRITPQQDTKVLDQNFIAIKDTIKNEFSFQLVTTTSDLEKKMEGAGEPVKVEKKATGKVVLFNNYDNNAQKLVATTRLETPEGLIFRLIDNVTIPGKKTVSGKATPGSVEANVIANVAGEAYNVGLKDFSIVGFKGDPKYTSVYARSKTPMTGGFTGLQKTVAKEALDKAEKELQDSLKISLTKDIMSQIPADFIIYNGSLKYKFEPITQSGSGTGEVILKKKGTVSGIIFNVYTLSQSILTKLVPNLKDAPIKIPNIKDLNFTYSTSSPFNPDSSTSVTFNLNGNVDLVWSLDENKLKSDLLGLSKNSAETIIGTYDSIKEAWIETRPFWNQTIPSDPKKVTVLNTLTK